jgi:hypothetical protein
MPLVNVKKPKFGLEGYYLPHTMHEIIKVPKWNKKDFKRSNDIYAESRKFVPPPGIYDLEKPIHDTKKYKIFTMDRKTFAEELPKLAVNKNPPPGTYNPKFVEARVVGPPKSTTPIAQFINEAEYRGIETSSPGQYTAKYS